MDNNSGDMNIMYKLHVIIIFCLPLYLEFSYLKVIFIAKLNQKKYIKCFSQVLTVYRGL